MNWSGQSTAVLLLLMAPQSATTAKLQEKTVQAFDRYIRATEARLERRNNGNKSFLWTDESTERQRKVREGSVVIEPLRRQDAAVPDGLIHDWIGAVFIPGATLAKTLALVQDYDNHKKVYQPEVVDSKLLSHNGNDYRVYLRLLKKKVLTVVLDTEHDVRYTPLDEKRCYSRSYSTRIAEVDGDQERPVGDDHGFLWRLYSYWRFQERDGGVYLECEAISLTRDIPTGLGWLIQPIIRNLPKESLAHTLEATRQALEQ
jgi:hypothetical protein